MTQPTHDEVIAWIDERIRIRRKASAEYPSWGTPQDKYYLASLLANRDVLDRHKADALNECPVCIATVEPCVAHKAEVEK